MEALKLLLEVPQTDRERMTLAVTGHCPRMCSTSACAFNLENRVDSNMLLRFRARDVIRNARSQLARKHRIISFG
jgi:hypothetical protein